MAWSISQGVRVISGQFGSAMVRRLDRSTALISLDGSGVEVLVPINTLSPEPSGEASSSTTQNSKVEGTIPEEINKRLSNDVQNKLQAVEALRFGLVPETEIESLTIHYPEFKSWVLSRLPDVHGGKPQVSEIYGPFGEGKSHMMTTIRFIAKQRGFIAAHVEVDGLRISLSDPERLLYSLWNSMKAKDFNSCSPILDLCIKALKKGHPAPQIAPRGIDRVHDNYNTTRLISRTDLLDIYGHDLNSIMVSSDEFTASEVAKKISRDPNINAFDVRVRRMIGQLVLNRPCDFVETWVGFAKLSQLAGYTGLVITIDEFEVERAIGDRQERVNDLLSVLTDYLKGNLDHPIVPLSVFFATVGQDGHRGDMFVDHLIDDASGEYYPLPKWSRENRIELSKRIFKLYSKAYVLDQEYSSSVVNAVEKEIEQKGASDSGLVRAFIKLYVSALDSIYGYPK